jgi:hypothetical protein
VDGLHFSAVELQYTNSLVPAGAMGEVTGTILEH